MTPGAGARKAWWHKLHWQIAVGLALGTAYGVLAALAGLEAFTEDWIAPFGVLFLNVLKLVAVPLVVTTLVAGVASLSDLRRLSRIGLKSMGLFLLTTVIACVIALALAATLRPGGDVPEELRLELGGTEAALPQRDDAERARARGPLAFVVDVVPENVVAAAADNRNLLQIVFVSLLLGAALIKVPREHSEPIVRLFQSFAHVTVALVGWLMVIAPVGVFALMASAITGMSVDGLAELVSLSAALGSYAVVLLLALVVQTVGVYAVLLRTLSDMPVGRFFRGISPAQLVAFSTSSSAATLPVTLEQCREKLDVPDEIASFVVPLGSTVHMNGTAIFLCVASLFLVQATGTELAASGYMVIALLATLGSIGAVAIPSIGIVFLIVILETLGVATAGVALILGVDRILDMARTVTNVTGDALVAVVVAASENGRCSVEPRE